ncbi:NADPH oxidase 4, partial [Stegodyphus mimosarum]
SVAHIINAVNFSAHYNSVYKDVNVANFKGEDPLNSVIKTVPGITGILMIVILCILS